MQRRSDPALAFGRVLGLTLLAGALCSCVVPGASRALVDALPGDYPEVVYQVSTDRCAIALTIDDGPDPETTPVLLERLEAQGAHATFFVIGSRVEGNEALLARMVTAGHELGHHMMDDRRSALLPEAEQRTRFAAAAAIVEPVAEVRWFRPGSGIYDDTLLELARERGYRIALASVFPLDTLVPSPTVVAGQILRSVRPGSIVVLHDFGARGRRTAQTLERLLPALAARGYQVLTLSELDALYRADGGADERVACSPAARGSEQPP